MSFLNSSTTVDDPEKFSSMEGSPILAIPLPDHHENIVPNLDDILDSLRTRDQAQQNTQSTHETSISAVENSVSDEAKLYQFLVNGEKEKISDFEADFERYKSEEDKNSVLHIAAIAGQGELITDILPKCKGVIMWKNIKGDLAYHSAAKAGHLNVLKALMNFEGFDREILGMRNKEGNTVLHIAVEHNREEMVNVLVDKYWEACYELNDRNVSPLYLGIKSGYWGVLERMISYMKQLNVAAKETLLQGKSVVHAAIEAKNIEVLKGILNNHRCLIDCLDDEDRTPLSYAAFKGYLEGVQYFLKEFPESAFKCNKDEEGSFPIHKAASGGNIDIIRMLFHTKLLLNRKEQNILHVAAANGRSKAVSYLLKLPELKGLVNSKDENGNTPLHLATKGFCPRVVYILTREKRCKCELQNKDGLTALDVAEICSESFSTFESRLTWMALRYVDAPRSSQSTRKYELDCFRELSNNSHDRKKSESYKDRVDTHLLVATLVATVTFAAGFTLPGGYNQSDPHIGMAVLAKFWAFKVFIVCNTAALYSAILSIVTLLWAYIGDLKLILVSLRLALLLLGCALAMMSLAFMMGIFVVLKNVPWLSYVVLGMGSLFLLVVLIFFIPLYNPSYIRSSVVRFFFSGTFLLLLLVCEKNTPDYA